MADNTQGPAAPKVVSASVTPAAAKVVKVSRDVVQIDFLIDDLVAQLVKDRFSSANCNGCNSCGGSVATHVQEEQK